jgi:hypothetical protein
MGLMMVELKVDMLAVWMAELMVAWSAEQSDRLTVVHLVS